MARGTSPITFKNKKCREIKRNLAIIILRKGRPHDEAKVAGATPAGNQRVAEARLRTRNPFLGLEAVVDPRRVRLNNPISRLRHRTEHRAWCGGEGSRLIGTLL